MKNKLEHIISKAYKNRFSLYYKPKYCLLRVYKKDGSQHKEIGETIDEAINKMLDYLELIEK
ncbi:MAG: hypothetical protein WA091_00935 [Minisyncoccales bacterium]